MSIPTVPLQLAIDAETSTLQANAVLGPDDHVKLNSLAQLNTDHDPGDQVTLHALDFTVEGDAYRVFAVTFVGEEQSATPWEPCPTGGCRFSFTMPEQGGTGPRFAICAVPVQQEAIPPRPFVSGGSGAQGGLPIKIDKTGGPGPSPT